MIPKLEVVPVDLRSLEYEVWESGTVVGRIRHTPLQALAKGSVRAGAEELAVLREGVLRASYQLRSPDGSVRARAERQGASGAAYRLRFADAELLLKKKVSGRRETYLLTGPGGQAASIVRDNHFSRKLSVERSETTSAFPAEILLFVLWLALLIHRRDDPGSAGWAS